MRRGRASEARRWRLPFVTASLLGTMAMSAAGAVAIHRAGVQHDREVEKELDEYLEDVTSVLASSLPYHTKALALRAFAPGLAEPGRPVSFARHVAHAAPVITADMGDGDALRGFFRLELEGGRYEARGAAARPAAAAAVRAAARTPATSPTHPEGPELVFTEMEGTPAAVFFLRELDAQKKPVAVVGFTVSQAHWFADVFDQKLVEFPMQPPPAVGEIEGNPYYRTDTLVHATVVTDDSARRVLYSSRPRFTSEARGMGGYGFSGGRFLIHATLHPAAVARVMAAHRHPERVWLVIGLPLLSALLAAAALVNAFRERELIRARHDFVAGVSHELRTPLAQIRMFAETLLLGRDRDEAERRKWLGVIRRESLRLGDLVENILFFTHLERGGLRVEPRPTALDALVDEILETYAPMAAGRKARLALERDPEVWAMADPRAVRQVVANLLDNALKYGPEGQTVAVAVAREETRARIDVTDEGPGIAPDERERCFKPFVRLTPKGGSAGGSGLGLAVARSIVRQHGGDVALGDAPGGGARFSVFLPLLADAPPSASAIGTGDAAAD